MTDDRLGESGRKPASTGTASTTKPTAQTASRKERSKGSWEGGKNARDHAHEIPRTKTETMTDRSDDQDHQVTSYSNIAG